MSVSQLAYLGIGVSDMPAWKRFATDILGMQMTETTEPSTCGWTRTITASRFIRAVRTTCSTSGCPSLVSATFSGGFLHARRAGPVVEGGDALPRPR